MKKPIYFSPSAKLWLYMCCFMNLYTIISYATQGYYYSSITLAIVVIGYLMLLFLHNRWGYVIAVGISLLTVVLTFSLLGISALLALFQPMLTWLFIKNDWRREPGEITDKTIMKGIRELILNAQPENEAGEAAPEAPPETPPEPETPCVAPPAREDLAKTMADIAAAIEAVASDGAGEAARDQARAYLLTKGRMTRVKIVQYIKNRLNAKDGGFDYGALLDVIEGLGLADNADILADMLAAEPYASHGDLAEAIADRLIALDCGAIIRQAFAARRLERGGRPRAGALPAAITPNIQETYMKEQKNPDRKSFYITM
jgi:hypothetical protein